MFFRLFLAISITALNGLKGDNDVWDYHLWLDPYMKYSIKWNINPEEEIITFLAEVKTKGWIGFGLSPNGGMKSSDVIIGWIDDNNGKTYFHDRYAKGMILPEIDESQDWILLDSKQNSSHTIMKFSRPYTTCDKQNDIQITRDTVRLIYAYNDLDPESPIDIRIHGRYQRGAKSALLLSFTEKIGVKPKEDDVKNFTMNVNNILIPPKETTYWCKLFKLPERKIHVVKFESFITPGNEPFAHHISVSACTHPDYNILSNHIESDGVDCSEYANMPKDFKHCTTPYFLWAVGGSPLTLPDDIGFPLGDEPSNTYLLLTIHYDNPYLVSGLSDSSGFRFYYTEKLRKEEAFTMTVGAAVDKRMFIPAKQHEFTHSSHCHPDCYRNSIPKNGLKIFAVRSHGHLTARKIKTRVFRGKKELAWIENDRHYDFNLQTFRNLNSHYKILAGDQITVECVYNTMDRNETTFGGPGSREEMCLSILFYYPRMINSKPCMSGLSTEGMMELAGIESVISKSNLEHIIQSPKHLKNNKLLEYVINKSDWNDTILENSYEFFLKHKQKPQCYWTKTETDKEIEQMIGYPELDQIYKPPEKMCQTIDTKSIEGIERSNIMVWIFIAFIIINILIINLVVIYLFRSKIKIGFQRI